MTELTIEEFYARVRVCDPNARIAAERRRITRRMAGNAYAGRTRRRTRHPALGPRRAVHAEKLLQSRPRVFPAVFQHHPENTTDPVYIPRLSSVSSPPLSILQPVLPKYVPGTVIGEAIPHRGVSNGGNCRTCPTSSFHGLISRVLAFPPL